MIETIFFWLGGTITPKISDLILSRSNIRPGSDAFHRARIFTCDLAAKLELGQLGWSEYIHEVEVFDPTFELLSNNETWLIEHLAPIDDLQDLFSDLGEKYSLWLLSDYPLDFFRLIEQKYRLNNWFQDKTVVIPELGMSRLLPDILYLALNRACTPIEKCLLISSQHRVTSAAVRAGISATVFVDFARLQREFLLRKMLPPTILCSKEGTSQKSFVVG